MTSVARRTLRVTAAVAGVAAIGAGLAGTAFALPGVPAVPGVPDVTGALPTGAVTGLIGQVPNPTDALNVPGLTSFEMPTIDTNTAAASGHPAGASGMPSVPGVTGGLPTGALPAMPSLDTVTATAATATGLFGELTSPNRQISGHTIGF